MTCTTEHWFCQMQYFMHETSHFNYLHVPRFTQTHRSSAAPFSSFTNFTFINEQTENTRSNADTDAVCMAVRSTGKNKSLEFQSWSADRCKLLIFPLYVTVPLNVVDGNITATLITLLYIQDLGLSVVCYKQNKHTDLLCLGLCLLPDGVEDPEQLRTDLLLMTCNK